MVKKEELKNIYKIPCKMVLISVLSIYIYIYIFWIT